MRAFERALPRLQEAHRLMWEVREVCEDDVMRVHLRDALDGNENAQRRLQAIDRDARGDAA